MANIKVRVAVNGYGVIGKRVADAVALQDDMKLFNGGEKYELTGYSFVAQVNYEGALNRDFTRVVSCNITALSRLMNVFYNRGLIKRARAVILRRGTDPWESHMNGMINTVIPETKVPSHQGPDAQTVIPGLDITTMAGAGPYNLSHIHYAMVETTRVISMDELRHALWEDPRIAFIRAKDGLVALNSVIELMRDLGRPRGDMWEVAVWEDALAADDREVYITYQVHNEAIVIPETIDAIRALTGIETDWKKSVDKTNRSMGIVKSFLPHTIKEGAVHAEMAKRLEETRYEFTNIGLKGSEEPE